MKTIERHNGDYRSIRTRLFRILMAIIVLPLLSISELEAQATDLTVLLETENDTLYFDQKGRIKVTVYKDSWFPSRIKIQRQIRTAANTLRIGAICLEVTKEGIAYQSMADLLVNLSKEHFLTSKWHPVVINGTVDIGNLFSEEQRVKMQTHQDGYHLNSKNIDFGAYQLRAVYFTVSGDTVCSNPVTIYYLKD